MKTIGPVPGIEVGATFENRAALGLSGIHPSRMQGIHTSDSLATSVVLSGGYDNEDYGDVIIYCGEGGRTKNSSELVADQELKGGNKGLVAAYEAGTPVRVTRGHNHPSEYAPEAGFRYDGCYIVESYSYAPLKGFNAFRFRLRAIDSVPSLKEQASLSQGNAEPKRKMIQASKIQRDADLAEEIKELHKHECQVCGIVISGATRSYAEAAHIRPLGRPHDGPDVPENILCLCPNHHKMLDLHCFHINDDFTLSNGLGSLRVHPNHPINLEHIRYHRDQCEKQKAKATT